MKQDIICICDGSEMVRWSLIAVCSHREARRIIRNIMRLPPTQQWAAFASEQTIGDTVQQMQSLHCRIYMIDDGALYECRECPGGLVKWKEI